MPILRHAHPSDNVQRIAAAPTKAQRPDTYPEGRTCIDCHSPLSIYNPGPECFAHAGEPILSERAQILQLMRQAA